MFNLLTEQKKDELRKNYVLRLIIVGSALFGTLVFVFGVVLISFSIVLSVEKEGLADAQNAADAGLDSADEKTLQDLRRKISILAQPADDLVPTTVLNGVNDARNSGVALTAITYETGRDGSISTSGRAETRDDLLLFLRTLEESELFLQAETPISALSKSVDIDFSITISLQENEG